MICPVLSKDGFDTSTCRTDCKWYLDGECAVSLIAKLLLEKAESQDDEDSER